MPYRESTLVYRSNHSSVLNICTLNYWRSDVEEIEAISLTMPIAVAARSKAQTVFARSNTKIVDWNPTGGMDVCVCVYSVSA
jgi:hypothetical protein